MKRLLAILAVLAILLGVPYGLAKIGVIPVAKLAAKNPALAKFARSIGLMPRPQAVKADTKEESTASLPKPATTPPSTSRPASPALAPLSHASSAGAGNQDNASRQVGWVAKVYENMEPEQAVRILEQMNDREVIALLRRMKQRQVASILALMPPDRAARLSKALMVQR
ncbi:MAG: magnesium transporter MgtE N-terminal domain-containing protein [Armatimonadota bacterium]